MKRKLNYTAALATTAAVGLLAGPAFAQAPITCTTTQINPAHNDCVMPTASAPGGGSFPGSFLVPGTNTSLAVHGFIQLDIVHDLGPHQGDTAFSQDGTPVDGAGITNATMAANSANGGTSIEVKPTRPNIETRTPTAYGSLNTYIEFDFNQTGGTTLGGSADVLRLRQAYGTLGPWLIGQTITLFDDPQTYPDTANAAFDAGMIQSGIVRKPQFRYTWLAGNGITVAGSLEMASYNPALGNSFGFATNTAVALTTSSPVNSVAGGYVNWPRLVAAVEWDQPWGHVKFAAVGEDNQFRAVTGTGTTGTINHENGAYAFGLTGHLNTWGKDALRAGFRYNHGAADYADDMVQGGEIYNTTTGTQVATKLWGIYGSYEHFFNGQWRANESLGYAHMSGNPFTVACTSGTACPQAGLEKNHFTNEVNVIYSPVPQTDFILEWMHTYRAVMSGASGRDDRLDGQFKFYF